MAANDMSRAMWAMADDYPFAQAPKGVTPNFEHPKLVGYHSMTIACATCIALLLLSSTARLYAKLRLVRTITIDDYFFIISLPMLLVHLSFYLYLDNHGAYGFHAWDFKIKELTKPILAITFLQVLITPVITWLIKTTLLSLILCAFKPVKWLRYLCYSGIAAAFAFYLANFLIVVISCHPRGGTDRIAFLAGMASHNCASIDGPMLRISIATGIFNVASDLYILIIPMRAVFNLRITRRKKIGVLVIFSAGGMGCIASILSLAFRCRAFGDPDVTVVEIPAMASNMVELSVGMFVACMAPISKLARSTVEKYLPSFISDTRSSNKPLARQTLEKRRHEPGGLSELDSITTFGTTIDEGITISHSVTISSHTSSSNQELTR